MSTTIIVDFHRVFTHDEKDHKLFFQHFSVLKILIALLFVFVHKINNDMKKKKGVKKSNVCKKLVQGELFNIFR